ncbi:glycosyltransferase family 39 protein [Patescibacteria group bacterium]|nr:glycosyltransferase family 39 protein [Patescibacteria group bacterium]
MSITILLGLLTSIIFFILARKKVSLSVLYLAFLLPLDNRIYFSWGFNEGSPVRFALLGIFTYLFFSYVRNGMSLNIKKALFAFISYIKKDIFLFLLLLVWLIRLISFSMSLNLISSLSYQLFFSEIILIYILVKKCVGNEGEMFILKFLRNYVLAGFLMSLYSPYQYYMYKFKDKILPGVWPLENRPVRIGSLFWDINHYGAYLATVIPFIPFFLIKAKSIKLKVFYSFAFLICLISFGMTLSRSAIIGLSAGGLLYLILFSLKGYFKQSLFILVSVAALSFGFIYIADRMGLDLSYQLQKRFLSINFSYRVWDDSINAHSALAYGSWQVMEENPIIGGGYGSFNEQFRTTEIAKTYFDLDPVKDAVIPPHSVWFEPLSATGLLGAVPFYLFFILICYALLTRYQKSKELGDILLVLGFISGLFAVSLSGFFYSYNLEFFYIFVFLALLYGASKVKKYPVGLKDVLILTFVITLAGAFIFYKLDAITLIDWDESIYAKVAKNILNGIGDPFNFVWQISKGSWFEKPPLFIWFTSLAFQLFGVNEFSARIFSALSGIGSVVALYFFGKNLFKKSILPAFFSCVVLATSVHYIFQSRNGTMDVLASFLILCSMFFFWRAREQKKGWWVVGVFLGLTVMAKSVIVVIPLVSLALFIFWDVFIVKSKRYSFKGLLTMFLWLLAVALPWHIVEYVRFGKGFMDSYFFYHILERSKGIEGHTNDFWWYLIVIKVWFRHWFVVAIPAILYAVFVVVFGKAKKFKKYLGEDTAPLMFLLIWILFTFFILSASVSKIQWYIVPIYPPLALLVGWFLSQVLSVKIFSKSILYVGILMVFLGSSFLVYYWRDMWMLDDYNRGLKNIGQMIAENRDRYEFLPRNVPVYIYNTSPGPALFYTLRYAKVVGKSNISEMMKSPDGKAFMAITTKGSFESLKKEFDNPRVIIYAESKGFVLFGKDWKDLREQFNQQDYGTPSEIYDPYYFCEWEVFGGNTLCF